MSKSNEQKVVELKEHIAILKDEYMGDLNDFVNSSGLPSKDKLHFLLKVQKSGNKYFNYIEDLVGNSGLLGAHDKSGHWLIGLVEDCSEALHVISEHYQILRIGVSNFDSSLLAKIEPTPMSYANMQRIVSSHLNKSQVRELRSKYIENSLPIHGFQNKGLPIMNQNMRTMLSFFFGVVFVIVLLAIAFVEPNPSSFQYMVFRIVLALAASGVVAVLPGFIELKLGKWLRATGALAVFAVVYFYNPASLVLENNPPPQEISLEVQK